MCGVCVCVCLSLCVSVCLCVRVRACAELREEDSPDKANDYIEMAIGRTEPIVKVSECVRNLIISQKMPKCPVVCQVSAVSVLILALSTLFQI